MTATTNTAIQTTTDAQPFVSAMLNEIAKLCVLGHVSRDVAIEMFRNGLDRASDSIEAPTYEDFDAFSAGQALGEWHNNLRFLDGSGRPAHLSIAAGEFDELCLTASQSADPARVLTFLTQAGAVSVRSGVATALRRDLILGSGHPGAVARAVELATAFSGTLIRNLTKETHQPSCFERTVVNTMLAKRHVPALFAYLGVHGQSFLEDIDSWMSSRESNDDGSRVGVGIYLFEGNTSR